jgi:hypothetical protein
MRAYSHVALDGWTGARQELTTPITEGPRRPPPPRPAFALGKLRFPCTVARLFLLDPLNQLFKEQSCAQPCPPQWQRGHSVWSILQTV